MEKIFYDNEYVLWLEFDACTSMFLNNKYDELTSHEIELGIQPPHLTLSFFRSDNEVKLKDIILSFFDNINDLSFELNSVGAFTGGVLYYEPKVTLELLQLHDNLCQALLEVADFSWDLYIPGNWSPHIALTGGLSPEQAAKAFTIMMNGFEGMKSYAASVKLSRITAGEEILNIKL